VNLSHAPTKVVRGITLRTDPAREACFTVAQTGDEMMEMSGFDEVSRRERLHRHMNNETGAIEIAAQCLADFPDAPWDLRLQLARQCWDEARHVQALHARLVELGGRKGEFPISNYEWGVTCMQDSLVGRLAVQNRTFEAGLMDLLGNLKRMWKQVGDERTAEVLDNILVDEIGHVRFANQWIRRLAEFDRRVLLKVAQSIRFLANSDQAHAPEAFLKGGGRANLYTNSIGDVNIEDRRHAEFTDDEIESYLRNHGLGGLLPKPSEPAA
jgi:uncharacterized ferritin-like protein (DUF455 family)